MQLFSRVSQYYILCGIVPFPRAGHINVMHVTHFTCRYFEVFPECVSVYTGLPQSEMNVMALGLSHR